MMCHNLRCSLFAWASFGILQIAALPNFSSYTFGSRSTLSSLVPRSPETRSSKVENRRDGNKFETETNGSEFVWLIQDTYEGQNFFERWSFFTQQDSTHGIVNFTDQQTAFDTGLAYVTANNTVVMKGDDTTWLAAGQLRHSVRITSTTRYNTGLFILDINHAPWGCGVSPAFWTAGPNSPYNGEIYILEGANNMENDQIAWHTGPGCNLTPNHNFTGTVVGTLDCDVTSGSSAGCAIMDWSRASYGPYFDAQGGGVYAMKWDDEGIAVWNFYRDTIPQDITDGASPNPSTWSEPAAQLSPAGCNPLTFFVNHSVIFDITFCGDWAGNSYASSGCPGTCADRVMDPSNFVNASWEINSLKIYQKAFLAGTISSGEPTAALNARFAPLACFLILTIFGLAGL